MRSKAKRYLKSFFCLFISQHKSDDYLATSVSGSSFSKSIPNNKRRNSSKKKTQKGNIYQYFHASLTIEIIYTVLNAIT